MNAAAKDERAAVRMSARQRQTIDAAANVSGQSLTDFMVQASMERALDVLADQRVFHVSAERWDELMDMTVAPAEPNPGLVDLFSRPSVFKQ